MDVDWRNGVPFVGLVAGVALAVVPERQQEYHASWTAQERERLAVVCKYYMGLYDEMLGRKAAVAGEEGSFSAGSWLCPAMQSWSGAEHYFHAWQVHGPRVVLIREVLRTGDVMKASERGESLLHLALGLGEFDLARSLVDRGADVNGQMAAVSESVLIPDGDTPLTLAMCPHTFRDKTKLPVEGRAAMVQCLLEHGADADGRSVAGYKPLYLALMWAARYPEYMQVVDLLLECSPDISDLGGENAATALGAAVAMGSPVLVERLCGMGADVRAVSNGRPPLLWVSPKCKDAPAIARFLLDRGAGADACFSEMEPGPGLDDVPVKRSLLFHLCDTLPAQLNGVSDGSERVRAGMRMLDVAKELLEKGASADFSHELSGETPLMVCCRHVARAKDGLSRELAMDMARLLLSHGASPNARLHGNGDSVLAFYAGLFREGRKPDDTDKRMVKLLADAGAVARFGKLPYGYARLLRKQWGDLPPELREKLPEVFSSGKGA